MFNFFFTAFSKKTRREIKKNAQEIVHYLSNMIGERTLEKFKSLSATRTFIFDRFKSYSYLPSEHTYTVKKRDVANIIVEIKGHDQPENIIIIGAHYDTVFDSPGANDNGSAVAALLELSRLFSQSKPAKTIRFVAFTLEEPPYFATRNMGSMRYAALCKKKKENIELMIAIDMIGIASKKLKQNYPLTERVHKLPKKGTFLSAVSLPSMSRYVYFWSKIYNKINKKKIIPFIGPASIPGFSFSDHQSFIKQKYPALMLTDTGFYRSGNYHAREDTYEKINFAFLTTNIIDIYKTVVKIADMSPLRY